MTRFILSLIRITALALSFLLSTFLAATFVTFTLFLGSDPSWLVVDMSAVIGSVGFTMAMWFALCRVLLGPFVLMMLIAEPLRWSSLLVNFLLGGLCAVIFMVTRQPGDPGQTSLPYSDVEIWLSALSAGFVGGFIHWTLAGHRAGRWLGPAKKVSADRESVR